MPKFPIRVPRSVLAAITAVAALLVSLGVVQVVDDSAPTPAAIAMPTATPTVTLGGPGHDTIPAPTSAAVTAAGLGLADHAGSRWDAALPAAMAEKSQAGLEKLAASDQLPLTSPDAAPEIPGCTSDFVRNYSSRGGVKPRELVAHYTVSPPGSALGVVKEFDTAAFEASSNFVIDADGRCYYIVRDTDKAWAQASANPFSVSIEFVAMGTEGKLTAAQLAKGGAVFAHEAAKWGIPIALGKVTDCLPTTPGIVDHGMLGICGGGHHDLRPFYGSSVVPKASDDAKVLAPLIAATKSAAAAGAPATITVLTAGEHTAAEQLLAQRRIAHRHHGWSKIAPSHLRSAVAAKASLKRAQARITAAAAQTGWDRARRRQRHTYIATLLA